MEVGVLVLTNFTYTYGSKVSAKQCGQWMTFNSSSSEELDEVKFILDSSYLKRGFLYVDNNIKEDFKNKAGIFAQATPLHSESPTTDSPQEEVAEPSNNKEIVNSEVEVLPDSVFIEERKAELNGLSAAEIKKIAEGLNIEYINKVKAIEAILNLEYPAQ